MSDGFNGKDYGDYFKSLERKLNTPDSESKEKQVIKEPPQYKASVRKKKKRRFFIFRLRKWVVVAFFLIIALIITVSVLPKGKKSVENTPSVSEAPKAVTKDAATPVKTEKKTEKIVFKADKDTVGAPSDNDAKSVIVINKDTGKIVCQRNSGEKRYIASTTKIMTLLVAAENITDFDDTFTMTYAVTDPLYIAEATVAGFSNNEKVSMTDLLYGTILPSGGDAAMGLAIKISGSEQEFVKLMNEKAKKLGLSDTHFANATGLHDEGNYSTAYDMAVILCAAMENPLCKEILSTYQYTTAKTPEHPDGILLSSTLFSYMYGTEPETATILGGKTGFVNESGYCIASFGKNNASGTEYIAVSLGNSSRWPAFYGQIDLYKEFAK